MKPLLQVRNLKIAFRAEKQWNEVVHGIDFDVFSGSTLGIVGESGSGKSVSSLALIRLLNEKSTRITADKMQLGEEAILNIKDMTSVRGKRIAMIFQEPMTSLNPVFKCGFQVVEAILAHEIISKHEARERVIALFKKVLLPRPETIFESYPHQLSGGQKQRVMIAMALACNPDILIADEPTTALDVTVQKEILNLLRDLQQQNGMGIIFITHDLGVVSEIADNVAVMHNGAIVEYGQVDVVLHHPQNSYTQGLLACRPPLNVRLKRLPVVKEFLEGTWQGGETEIVNNLALSAEDREKHLQTLYAQKPLLQVSHLQTWFPIRKGLFGKVCDNVKAVDDVSFDVYRGETLGLVGESGCGKTTLGRSLLRLVEPSAGTIIFDGLEVMKLKNKSLREYHRQVQIVFQDPYSSLNPKMSIGEAIAEPLKVHKLEPDAQKRRKRVEALLSEVGLQADYYERYPHEFSGGQRQRICIARALAVNPRLIICDESVSALDVSVQAQVLNLLNRLKRDFDFTYIFISHDLSVVRFMSDRIMVMRNGKMVEIGEADMVFRHPKEAYTQKLIDALPGKNILHL